MGETMKKILTKPKQLADQITKAADEVIQFKPECLELQSKTKKLADLIRQAARANNDLYARPTRRIINDTQQVLERVLALVNKCRTRSLLKRVFTMIPNSAFRKMIIQLDNSIGDVTWILQVTAARKDDDDEESRVSYLGLPPIASNEPILCLIWEHVANLSSGTSEERSDAAASLVSLANDNERYRKMIVEEGGVAPLLKLAKEEGNPQGQENAARCIGVLGRDQESVEAIIKAGVCSVFSRILKDDGVMKVQAVVAWAISELVNYYPKCQDDFAESNVIRLLVSHLAFGTIEEHSKYGIAKRNKMSASSSSSGMQSEHEMANVESNTMRRTSSNNVGANGDGSHNVQNHQNHTQQMLIKGRESEDPEVKSEMKSMAARALWQLAKGNAPICTSITESKALLCFAVLLEKGHQEEVKYNSAMAIMEITKVAEKNSDLRRTAFKPTSPTTKAIVEQLLKVVTNANYSNLLIPCIKSLGNLARTFRATETRIIDPLVKFIDVREETEVMLEAVMALVKFACSENYLHVVHCKSIIEGSGVKFLIQLVYFGEQVVRVPALMLLCYVALHVPDNEVLAQEDVLTVLEWANQQGCFMQNPQIDGLLPEAKCRLELYQSRGSRF